MVDQLRAPSEEAVNDRQEKKEVATVLTNINQSIE